MDKEAIENFMKALGYGPYSEETLLLIDLMDDMQVNRHKSNPHLSDISVKNSISRGSQRGLL